jgi:hypothetical protein
MFIDSNAFAHIIWIDVPINNAKKIAGTISENSGIKEKFDALLADAGS